MYSRLFFFFFFFFTFILVRVYHAEKKISCVCCKLSCVVGNAKYSENKIRVKYQIKNLQIKLLSYVSFHKISNKFLSIKNINIHYLANMNIYLNEHCLTLILTCERLDKHPYTYSTMENKRFRIYISKYKRLHSGSCIYMN